MVSETSLCGIIVGVRTDANCAYMLPIVTIVTELAQLFPGTRIRLPQMSDVQTLARSWPKGRESLPPEAFASSVPDSRSLALPHPRSPDDRRSQSHQEGHITKASKVRAHRITECTCSPCAQTHFKQILSKLFRKSPRMAQVHTPSISERQDVSQMHTSVTRGSRSIGRPWVLADERKHLKTSDGSIPDVPSKAGDDNHKRMVKESEGRSSILPAAVDIELSKTFDDQQLDQERLEAAPWTSQTRYVQFLQDAVEKSVARIMGAGVGVDVDVVEKRCICRVRSKRHTAGPYVLVDGTNQLPDETTRSICGFISSFPFESFWLQVRLDYSSSRLRPIPDLPYGLVVRKEIMRKSRQNFLGREYVPRSEMSIMTKGAVLQRVFAEDESISTLETSQLLEIISQDRCRGLFLSCLEHHVPLAVLHHLTIDAGLEDSNWPALTHSNCMHWLCGKYNADLTSHSGRFFTPVLDNSFQRTVKALPRDTVMPVESAPDSLVGVGAFSKVFKVWIDGSHFSKQVSWSTPQSGVSIDN